MRGKDSIRMAVSQGRIALVLVLFFALLWNMLPIAAQQVPILFLDPLSNQTVAVKWSIPPSQAPGIISWHMDVNSTVTGSNQIAGVVPASYWNNTLQLNGNATGDPVVSSNLVDNLGKATTLTVAQNSSQYSWNYWAVRFSTPDHDADGTYNGRLLNGYQNKGASEAPYDSSITVTGIPYSEYDLYVYFSSDTAGRNGSVRAGNTIFYFSTLGPAEIGGTNALVLLTADSNPADNPPADYAVFSGLTGALQTITVSIPEWGGISGFQIVQRAGAATNALTPALVLQETGSLTPPVVWSPSTRPINSNSSSFSVALSTASGARFFRLASENGSPGFSGQYITNGLVAFWKLNDGIGSTALDASGNGFGLSLLDSPIWGANSLNLDGSTQYGNAGTNFAANLDQQDKTICAWVKKIASSQKGIVDKSYNNPGVSYGGWGFWVLTNQQLMWITTDIAPIYDTGAAGVELGQWTFVSVVWHFSSQTADFYINGVLDSAAANGAAVEFPSGTAELLVGSLRNNASNGAFAFDGALRDVAIYNRALSATEIETNYLGTELSTNVAYPDLLYYKMTESANSNPPVYLADSSTHGRTTGAAYAANVLQWETNVASIPATSIHFNGTATFIDTSNSFLFNFTTNLFTINLWVMPLTANGFLLENSTGETNGWFLNVGGAYSLNFFEANNGANAFVSTSAGAVRNVLFTMVTVVRTGPTNVVFYINGNRVATTGTFGDPAPSADSLIVGVDRSGQHHLDGNIWLLQIWSSALPAGDVANLYFHQVTGVPWP